MRVVPDDIVTPVAPTTGTKLATPKPLVVPILRAGLGMLDGMMRLLPDRRGRLPRHGPQRGDPRGLDVRRAAARRPLRAPVLRARPDARHRRHAGRGDPLPHRPRRRPHHLHHACSRRPRAAPTSRPASRASTCRSPSSPRPWTSGSTRRATSCPGLGDAGDRLYGLAQLSSGTACRTCSTGAGAARGRRAAQVRHRRGDRRDRRAVVGVAPSRSSAAASAPTSGWRGRRGLRCWFALAGLAARRRGASLPADRPAARVGPLHRRSASGSTCSAPPSRSRWSSSPRCTPPGPGRDAPRSLVVATVVVHRSRCSAGCSCVLLQPGGLPQATRAGSSTPAPRR